MSVTPVGTFCYRLLVEPALGEGLGNTVYVGLDVQDVNERATLAFSGLPQQVNTVRNALDNVRIFDGHLFETTGPTNARELKSAMGSMTAFAPKVVLGEALLANLRDIEMKVPTFD